MVPAEVRFLRNRIGGTRAMAERLHVTDRAVRAMCQHGIKRRSTIGQVQAPVETPG